MPLIRPDNSIPIPALLKRFALIYLPIVMVLSIALLLIVRLDEQRQVEKREVRESSRIEIARGLVTRDLSMVDTDLRLIANLPLLRWYQDSGNPAYREELEKLFLVLAREARLYDQVRYLDASGQEVIRINYNNGKPAIVPHEQLQNKSERYYFRDTIKLNQNEIFVSPLDLNIEQDRLEIPHKPMIRFGTPVFDSAGRKKGVILLNYLGSDLLQHFREIMQGGDPRSGMLLNRDGYWLSGAKHEDEWGFMLGKSERTFGRDFAEEWRTISAAEQGTLQTTKGLFVYTTVYPLLPGQHSSTGSTLAHAPSQQELTAHDYYWKIVSFVPRAVLSGTAFYNQPSIRILLAVVYLLLALASFVIAFTALKRKQEEEILRISALRYRLLFESSRDALMTVAPPSWKFTGANEAAVKLFGASSLAEFTALGPWDVSPERQPDGRPSGEKAQEMIATAMRVGSHMFEWEHQRLGGQPFAANVLLTRMEVGEELFLQANVRDISERKKLEDELKRQARIDLLTGLNNRRHFFELAEQELARAKRYGAPLQALMLDVDHFKLVNDTYGHHAGDLVLQKLSEVCVQTLRGIDILGRLGGEEFAILLPETKGEQALEVAERLRLAVAGAAVPLEQGGSIHLTVSIGVASVAATDARIEDLLKRADTALYAAKNAGRNRVCCEGIG
ncbi:MAG TPA: diguanylate cyclase [Gallionella sp.]|nr:diguanylate cyclase [Gallionella sp.]